MDRQIVQMQYHSYRFRYRIELESSSSLIFKNREQILEIVVIFAHVFIEDCLLKNFIFICLRKFIEKSCFLVQADLIYSNLI